MPTNYAHQVPASAIRVYFERFGLPLRMSLDSMPDAATMRKIKYRAAQLEERWNAVIENLSLDDVLDSVTGRVVVTRSNQFKIVPEDYRLKSQEVVLANMDNVNLDGVSIDALATKLNEILEPRFYARVSGNSYEKEIRITSVSSNRAAATEKVLTTNFGSAYRVTGISNNKVNTSSARQLIDTARKVATDWVRYYRAVLREGMVTSFAKPITTHDTSANLEKYLDSRHKNYKWDDVHNEVIETLPVATHGTLSSRTWGIEVESGGARGIAAPAGGWDRKGDGSLYSAYGGDAEDDYEDYDEDDSGRDCGEFVSPILHSFHSKGLESLLTKLATQPQNDSAGVHVHVGAKDLTARQIGGLVFAYEMIEPLIESSYRRQTREYCKKRPTNEVMNILKAAKTAKYKSSYEYSNKEGSTYGSYSSYEFREGQPFIPAGDRYVSLNLHSLDAHGTVEFRAMGPVYEYEHLIQWAHFCREMVNLAKKDVPSREWSAVKTFDDVKMLFAKYGVETPAILFGQIMDTTLIEDRADEMAEV